mmetsp:Transcript_3821/g.13738  ORF Transcript_3821/g.13738 Transcript_3821/m.13738 type:complete len:206 (-) Transcript_3821:512-1129(-)
MVQPAAHRLHLTSFPPGFPWPTAVQPRREPEEKIHAHCFAAHDILPNDHLLRNHQTRLCVDCSYASSNAPLYLVRASLYQPDDHTASPAADDDLEILSLFPENYSLENHRLFLGDFENHSIQHQRSLHDRSRHETHQHGRRPCAAFPDPEAHLGLAYSPSRPTCFHPPDCQMHYPQAATHCCLSSLPFPYHPVLHFQTPCLHSVD